MLEMETPSGANYKGKKSVEISGDATGEMKRHAEEECGQAECMHRPKDQRCIRNPGWECQDQLTRRYSGYLHDTDSISQAKDRNLTTNNFQVSKVGDRD